MALAWMAWKWSLYVTLVCSAYPVQQHGRTTKLNAQTAWVTVVIACVCAHLIPNLIRVHLTGMDTMARWTDETPTERMVRMQEQRDTRRLKRRRTKMVIDNGGIRKLREARQTHLDETIALEPDRTRPKR